MEKSKLKTGGIAKFIEEAKNSQNNPNVLNKIIEAMSEKIDELQSKAAAYDRLMSGGRKTLKEWANLFGMVVAVDQNGEASCFGHIPVMYLDDGEGIWTNSPEHYGEETYLLPTHLIDFDGDWKDSLTLPDGWEEK